LKTVAEFLPFVLFWSHWYLISGT